MSGTFTPNYYAESRVGLAGLLNREWDSLYADKAHVYGDWLTMTGGEALDFLRSTSRDKRDLRLLFLLRLARQGDVTAERVVLHAFLPKAISLSRSCSGLRSLDRNDAICSAVSALWETIRTIKLSITSKLVSCLVLNTLRLISVEYPTYDSERPSGLSDLDMSPFGVRALSPKGRMGGVVNSNDDPVLFDEFDCEDDTLLKVMRILSWASEAGILKPHQIKRLGMYSTMNSKERKEWAKQEGIAYTLWANNALRDRQQLAAAISQTVVSGGE